MEMLGKVRRMHLRENPSLHEVSNCTGLSNNTLRIKQNRRTTKALFLQIKKSYTVSYSRGTDDPVRSTDWRERMLVAGLVI